MLESKFQAELIKELEHIFDGCVIMKNDPNYRQGFPDLLILFGGDWATLEVKASERAGIQPNQGYWIERLDEMSFSAFIFPENKDAVLENLKSYFECSRLVRGSW